MPYNRTIDEIVETLQNALARKRSCTLLIGAGCSVKAGIPAAAGFVDEIREKYPNKYKRVAEKTYSHCMAALNPDERQDLIAGYVDKARTNWAHVCIAQLMKHGYANRVLTTNFDPLAVRACALLGEFPTVYDLAASQFYRKAGVPRSAVFHLHGQRNGFRQLHTQEELDEHFKHLKPVFAGAGEGRVWIVVGYSGENDPVFNHLARVKCFDYDLYWIGYNDAEPATHVKKHLLQGNKHAFYVKGYDADGFFIELTQKLEIFPPDFIKKPFSHLLDGVLNTLTSFPTDKGTGETDVTQTARKIINEVIQKYEQEPVQPVKSKTGGAGISDAIINQVMHLYMAAKYDKVVGIYERQIQGKEIPAELKDCIYWSYTWQGIALSEQAKTKSGAAADDLFKRAGEKYAAALEIKPDKHEALRNWGIVLSEQAKTQSGAAADDLFKLAGEKYAAALKIKPDIHAALYNWGLALEKQAKTQSGAAADKLFKLAGEKYAAALKIKPDYHEALNNWGFALLLQSRLKEGREKQEVYAKVGEVLERAEAVKPGSGSYNMACLMALQGDEDGCRKWLETCKKHGELPSREHMLEDADLASVRDKDWFRKILKSARE